MFARDSRADAGRLRVGGGRALSPTAGVDVGACGSGGAGPDLRLLLRVASPPSFLGTHERPGGSDGAVMGNTRAAVGARTGRLTPIRGGFREEVTSELSL